MKIEIGKIVRGNRPIASQVKIQLYSEQHPRPNDWSGQFTLPPGATADLGRARMVLADGRSGDVMLYRMDAGPERTIVVNFWGVGSLRRVG